MKRKIIITALCFDLTIAFAGTMGPACVPGQVGLPCAATGWGFGAKALYLQPSFSGHAYIGSDTTNSATGSQEYFINKRFQYGFGFQLEALYQFRTGNDLNLNWYYYDHTTHQGLPSGISVLDSPFAGNVQLRLEPRWNAVNLELGQQFNVGEWQQYRLHAGMQYANIRLNNITTGTITTPGFTQSRSNDSRYSGFGPRFGGDFYYTIWQSFTAYAKGAAAVLVGNYHFTRDYYLSTVPGLYNLSNSGSARASVPELEGKLGFNYAYPLYQGTLTFDLGWMWANYLNAVEIADIGHNGRTKESSFSIQGLTFGLKWNGNLA